MNTAPVQYVDQMYKIGWLDVLTYTASTVSVAEARIECSEADSLVVQENPLLVIQLN